LIASMSHLPTPGHEKIVSVRIAPVNSTPTCRPITVMTGISALRNACSATTRRVDRPFARAVRM
jgi:hypothetical protein